MDIFIGVMCFIAGGMVGVVIMAILNCAKDTWTEEEDWSELDDFFEEDGK